MYLNIDVHTCKHTHTYIYVCVDITYIIYIYIYMHICIDIYRIHLHLGQTLLKVLDCPRTGRQRSSPQSSVLGICRRYLQKFPFGLLFTVLGHSFPDAWGSK